MFLHAVDIAGRPEAMSSDSGDPVANSSRALIVRALQGRTVTHLGSLSPIVLAADHSFDEELDRIENFVMITMLSFKETGSRLHESTVFKKQKIWLGHCRTRRLVLVLTPQRYPHQPISPALVL